MIKLLVVHVSPYYQLRRFRDQLSLSLLSIWNNKVTVDSSVESSKGEDNGYDGREKDEDCCTFSGCGDGDDDGGGE